LDKWVDNLKPNNDLQLKVVRGNMCAVIGGGAKIDNEDAAWVPWIYVGEGETQKFLTFDCDSIVIETSYPVNNRCSMFVKYKDEADEQSVFYVDCNNMAEFQQICTFLSCVANTNSGSLKSYDNKKKVQVRGWKESARHYVESGFPLVYELDLKHVIVGGI